MRGSLMRGRHREATELVRKSRNVSRTRVATLNVGTLTGRSRELVEALEGRRVDFCAVQESRWSCRKSRDMGPGFKAVLSGSPRTTSGVGIIAFERFRGLFVSAERFDDRLMKIVVATKERLYHFFSAYAPQTGCSDQAKGEFWNLLDERTAEVLSKDVIIVAGDLNGHVGATKDGYSCHGGFGYGSRNADGERILEYAESHSLTIVNTVFRKRDSHLISNYSGSSKSQIDFVLVRDRDRSLVTDAKIVPYETVAPTAPTADLHSEDCPSEAEAGRAMRCCKNQVVANEREGSSCDFSRAVTDSHDCRRNLEENDRRDSSSCTVGTRHYEAWATEGRQAGMAVDR
ncbi:unnamed protein product [Heligmosomoides polygyrus]|uniref:Endo/exonuclease/phosphatase domain-containing protein n=1 Tax=Heligmosomoides polygyrus TaxID=6339 RepID=A0A183GFG2_HELPZ|nr:unnamed protein product [Heligmosomoides polygyrus]